MKWEKKAVPGERIKEISARYGCDLLTATVLARRGVVSPDAVKFFLEDDLRYLRNPFELPGMEEAVDRVLAARDEGEKVLVFGDSDVDGVTGTALLFEYLSGIGLDVSWRIPGGDDPYGLSMEAVEEFAAAGGTLIVTVDCGVSRHAEIRRAGELSVDVVVTDHHEPGEELPQALVVLNPKLRGSTYPFKDLCGCAVAFKLASALRFAQKSELYGQSICLLNARPVNDAWIVEVAKMRNLAVTGVLAETIVPGMIPIGDTRLPEFLEGQPIYVWDAPLQRRALASLFGSGVEIGMMDAVPGIGAEIPQVAGKSLLRVKELSTIAKYSEGDVGELDVFVNLFRSFIWKREKIPDADECRDLQLAALGTIGDIMPMVDENRLIVKGGLKSMSPDGSPSAPPGRGPRPGIAELLEKLGLAGGRFDAKDLSWKLCPTINAARRMGEPEKAARLMFERDPVQRDALARGLLEMNGRRKELEEKILGLVEPMAKSSFEELGEKLVLVYGEEINKGVTGLVAQRLAKRFKVPAIAVCFSGDARIGSIRSARGYVVGGLLGQFGDLFLDSGGHDFAGGFSLTGANWDAFVGRLKVAARAVEFPDEAERGICVDAELPSDYLDPVLLLGLLDRFAPYGSENEQLTFLAKKLTVEEVGFIGRNESRHLKLTLACGRRKWPALFWDAADRLVNGEFGKGDAVDVVFNVSREWYKGVATPRMILNDLRVSE